MSNYNTLKATINANIKQNGNQEITGQILNSVLNQMVTTLGAGYQFAGVATTATNPGTPDAKVFYIANGKGKYTNFGGLEVTEDEVVVLYYDTEWHKVATGIASQAKLSELSYKVNGNTRNIEGLIDQVEHYAPIEITGDVTNAADEEDLTSVDGLLKLKNRSSLNGMGYVILRRDKTFAEQVTTPNTIYEIRYDFDLKSEPIISFPNGCILDFRGGSISNASFIWNYVKLIGNVHLFNITRNGGYLGNCVIEVEWFGTLGDGTHDDSRALITATKSAKKTGCTILFGSNKTYLHGDGLIGDDGTGNSYEPMPNNSSRPLQDKDHPANIGRDIRFIFGKYENLTIEGNGSTILSNPGNGECRNSAGFYFWNCTNILVKNLSINGNKALRNSKFNDYNTGDQVFTEDGEIDPNYDATTGYANRGNIEIRFGKNIRFENVISDGSLMDGFCFASSNDLTDGIELINCVARYNHRMGLTLSSVNQVLVRGGEYSYSGFTPNFEVMGCMPMAGIDVEADSYKGRSILIQNVKLVRNKANGIVFSKDSSCIRVDGCYFDRTGVYATPGSANNIQLNNEISNCYFKNGFVNLIQEGLNIHHNYFFFDKEGGIANNYWIDDNCESLAHPSRFEYNLVRVNPTDCDDLSLAYGAMRVRGNCIVRGNTFENILKSSSAAYPIQALCAIFSENNIIRDSVSYPRVASGLYDLGHFYLSELSVKKYKDCRSNNILTDTDETKNNGNFLLSYDPYGYRDGYVYKTFYGNGDKWVKISFPFQTMRKVEVEEVSNNRRSVAVIKSSGSSTMGTPICDTKEPFFTCFSVGTEVYIHMQPTSIYSSIIVKVSSQGIKNLENIDTYISKLSTAPTLPSTAKQQVYLEPIMSETPSSPYEGFEYYNTQLKRKLLWNGSAWVNPDGTTL